MMSEPATGDFIIEESEDDNVISPSQSPTPRQSPRISLKAPNLASWSANELLDLLETHNVPVAEGASKEDLLQLATSLPVDLQTPTAGAPTTSSSVADPTASQAGKKRKRKSVPAPAPAPAKRARKSAPPPPIPIASPAAASSDHSQLL